MNQDERVFASLTVLAIANENERKVVGLARFTERNRLWLLSTSKNTKARKRRRNNFLSMPLVIALDQSERWCASSIVPSMVFTMSSNGDPTHRNKPMLRDQDVSRLRMPNNDSHPLNLPPPPMSLASSSINNGIRPSPIPGNFNIPPPPTPTVAETMSTFNRERLNDVLLHGSGSYVFIEHFGLVPKLNHF